MQPSILIADDHIMISKGLRRTLELFMGYTDIQSVKTCSRVLEELKKGNFTHLILDIGLSDGSAMEILPNIKTLYPKLRILIYSGKPADAYLRSLGQYGIRYFLSKEQDDEVTKDVLQKFFYDKHVSRESLQNTNPFSKLTPREMEVLHYVLQGTGINKIGEILNLKQNTVSTLKGRIFEKTETGNIRQLIDLATLYNLA